MIEINLIPDVKQELIHAERIRSVVISASIVTGIVAIAIVVVLSAWVFGVQTVRSALDDNSIKSGGAQLAGVQDLSKVLTIQNQLTKISQLNDEKHVDSRVFDVLAAVIPPAPNDVKISNLVIDAPTNNISFEGQTAGYDSLETFKKTIDGAVMTYTTDGQAQQTKLAADISTTDVSFGEDTTGQKVLRFTISFTYPDQLFSPTIPAVVIKLTNQGNVTDSYLGIPKSIFVQRASDIPGGQ